MTNIIAVFANLGYHFLYSFLLSPAREQEQECQVSVTVEENHQRVSRTFEWVHTQVGNYDTSDSRINEGWVALIRGDRITRDIYW